MIALEGDPNAGVRRCRLLVDVGEILGGGGGEDLDFLIIFILVSMFAKLVITFGVTLYPPLLHSISNCVLNNY